MGAETPLLQVYQLELLCSFISSSIISASSSSLLLSDSLKSLITLVFITSLLLLLLRLTLFSLSFPSFLPLLLPFFLPLSSSSSHGQTWRALRSFNHLNFYLFPLAAPHLSLLPPTSPHPFPPSVSLWDLWGRLFCWPSRGGGAEAPMDVTSTLTPPIKQVRPIMAAVQQEVLPGQGVTFDPPTQQSEHFPLRLKLASLT